MTNIDQIIDYSAYRAGRYVPGLAAVSAMGSELYADPLRPGQKIAASTEWPAIPLTHQSLEPSAPKLDPYTQDGVYEIVWSIPMRLWVAKAPIDQIRRLLLPYYIRYLAAFGPDTRLGGLCQKSRIAGFAIANAPNGDWAWLQIMLSVTEVIDFE